jgi:hypothetical protein
VKSGFKDTLDVLVDLTEKEVKGAISFIWASSQCPNVDLKIEASIQWVYTHLCTSHVDYIGLQDW